MKKRNIAVYFAWSRPEEIGAPLGELENRYPTLFEFRRALWPVFERLKGEVSQDVSGFLEHVILPDFALFARVVREKAGTQLRIIERVKEPPTRELTQSLLDGCDTLIVVSLDHLRTKQTASPAEIDCVREFLSREDRCVYLCPHHDIGATRLLPDQTIEWNHHRDRTIPGEQRIGGFALSLLDGLGFDVRNRWGLNPGAEPDGRPSPLLLDPDIDTGGLLDGVTTFNLHPHLPHFEFAASGGSYVDVLARQSINPGASVHPFTQAGNRFFQALLRLLAPQQWPGRVFVCDATLWSAAFGGLDSLKTFWGNVSTMD